MVPGLGPTMYPLPYEVTVSGGVHPSSGTGVATCVDQWICAYLACTRDRWVHRSGAGTAEPCRLQCEGPSLAGVTGSVYGRKAQAVPAAEGPEKTGEPWRDGMRPT